MEKILYYTIDYLWETDLVDMTKLSSENDGVKYLNVFRFQRPEPIYQERALSNANCGRGCSTYAGATVFSCIDASSGCWQIPLDEESSYLTTYNTPFGRYRYLCMPFGISSASEIWQRSMEEEFGDIEGAEIIVDDLVV